MHIIPAAKGLLQYSILLLHAKWLRFLVVANMPTGYVAGHLQFTFGNSSSQPYGANWTNVLSASSSGGVLIHHEWISCADEELGLFIPKSVQYLLVIEKQGIFHRLRADGFFK
jgi:DNA topoisomerase VI subunit A